MRKKFTLQQRCKAAAHLARVLAAAAGNGGQILIFQLGLARAPPRRRFLPARCPHRPAARGFPAPAPDGAQGFAHPSVAVCRSITSPSRAASSGRHRQHSITPGRLLLAGWPGSTRPAPRRQPFGRKGDVLAGHIVQVAAQLGCLILPVRRLPPKGPVQLACANSFCPCRSQWPGRPSPAWGRSVF